MVTLAKSGNAIVFTFDDNDHYLNDGTIEVPVNSLTLVTDESQMATFKKSATNDIFISATYNELGMSKADLESWFKENACGSTGISEEEVEAMISADTVNYFDGAEYDSENKVINFLHGDTVKAYIDTSDFVVDGMIDDVSIETISGETYLVIDFNTASGKEDILIPLSDIFDADNYYTKDEVDAVISAATTDMATQTWVGQQGYITGVDLSDYATQEYVAGAVSGKADTSAVTASLSGKQDTLSAGTGISISGNVISSDAAGAEGVTQAEYDAMVQAGTVDPDKIYIITDAQPIDMSNYWTSGQTQSAITSATTDMATQTWVGQQGYITGVDLSDYATQEYVSGAVSGKADSSRVDTIEEVTARALVDLDEKKADTSAVTTSLSGKQDTLVAGSGITISGNVISAEGGGATYSAGRGIAIDSGNTISFDLPIYNHGNSNIQYYSTNNTFSYYSSNSGKFHTNQVNGSGNTFSATSTSINGVFYNYINGNNNSIKLKGNGARGQYNLIVGYNNNLYAESAMNPATNYNFVLGRSNSLGGSESIVAGFNNSSANKNFLFGTYLTSNYELESSFGQYNISNTGSTDADKTFFSIGNGTDGNARHNAFEIRRNGDIYCNNGTADIKLQDYLQIKVMAISQADYDALVQGGTVDANTLYVINNVVS